MKPESYTLELDNTAVVLFLFAFGGVMLWS